MKTYITSDLHFNHKNICGPEAFEDKRKQFKNVEEMNEYLIRVHNQRVTSNDEVIMLGDFALHGKSADIFELYKKLNGSFIIVKGNHDGSKVLNYLRKNNYKLADGRDKFTIHDVGFTRKQNGITYYFTHYPVQVGHFRNNLRSICGHIHSKYAPSPNMLNVGIDSPELPKGTKFGQPILLQDAYKLVEEKLAKAIKQQELNEAKIEAQSKSLLAKLLSKLKRKAN